MKRRGSGHILNSASLSGLYAMPGSGIYTASKYAVVGISETLRIELEAHGIGVSVLCPGWVHTRIDETTRTRDGIDKLPAPTGGPPLGWCMPDDVARLAIAGIKRNELYIQTHTGGATRAGLRFDAILQSFARAT
jgi:short-subunit dehydrogenase